MLQEAISLSNPVDDLLELAEDLYSYEQQLGMSSAEFFDRFQKGTLDDDLQHNIGWATKYSMFLKLKRQVESTLMRAALIPEAAYVPA